MARRYVEVPREMMVDALTKAGFTPASGTNELTFERAHRLRPDLVIRIFTGFPVNAGEQRGCGEDAIRIVLLYKSPTRGTVGVRKFSRVFRTGSPEKVLARTLERAREAYMFANECETCPRCRGRAYPRGGRCIARCTTDSRGITPTRAEPPRGLSTPAEKALRDVARDGLRNLR